MNAYIKTASQVKKPQANCSVLIDVLNHVILDAAIEPCMTSEIPMLFRHLENCESMLQGKKVILLCDRYYGSAELFLYCQLHEYDFVIRNKSYVYKDYVAAIENDGNIRVPFNNAWYKRMKRDDCRAYAQTQSALSVRVVKNSFSYILDGKKGSQEPNVIDSVYLSSLSPEKFSKERIVRLYHTQRWDNETAYFDIKNHLEAERFNSGKYNIVVNELYGKILCYDICGALYEEADVLQVAERPDDGQETRYDYIPNMKSIADTIRTDHQLMQYLERAQT